MAFWNKKKDEEKDTIEVSQNAMNDINRELLAKDIITENNKSSKQKAQEATKTDVEDFKKQLVKEDIKNYGEGLKKDFQQFKTNVDTGIEKTKKVTSASLKRFAKQEKTKSIDPLAGIIKKSSKTKRKRGRPRKYKPIPSTGRPRGRPLNKSMRIGKLDFYEDEGVPEIQREPYVPPTPQQQRLLQLFGNKQQFWGFGGNPVKINKKLNSGNGLIKSGDGGATGRMFGIRR